MQVEVVLNLNECIDYLAVWMRVGAAHNFTFVFKNLEEDITTARFVFCKKWNSESANTEENS